MGKKTSKTKSTTTLPAWAQPIAQNAADTMQGAVNANQPAAQATADQIRGYLPGLGQKAFGNDPTLGAAQGYAQDVLGGKYLNGNPYLDAMIGQTANDVSDRVNALFGRSGASLGTAHAGTMTRELANAENSMRFNNYSTERANMGQAASQAPSLFGAQFAGVPSYLSAATGATQIPLMGPTAGLGVGGLWSGTGTTSSTQPGGWGNQVLGAAAAALPFIMSDRRLKKNIKKVGEAKDGLGIYEYEYRFDPSNTRVCGVMADEVAKLRPHAHVPNYRGDYAGVNYAALGSLD